MNGRRTGDDVFVGRADAVSKRENERMNKMISPQGLDEADMTGISSELNPFWDAGGAAYKSFS